MQVETVEETIDEANSIMIKRKIILSMFIINFDMEKTLGFDLVSEGLNFATLHRMNTINLNQMNELDRMSLEKNIAETRRKKMKFSQQKHNYYQPVPKGEEENHRRTQNLILQQPGFDNVEKGRASDGNMMLKKEDELAEKQEDENFDSIIQIQNLGRKNNLRRQDKRISSDNEVNLSQMIRESNHNHNFDSSMIESQRERREMEIGEENKVGKGQSEGKICIPGKLYTYGRGSFAFQ